MTVRNGVYFFALQSRLFLSRPWAWSRQKSNYIEINLNRSTLDTRPQCCWHLYCGHNDVTRLHTLCAWWIEPISFNSGWTKTASHVLRIASNSYFFSPYAVKVDYIGVRIILASVVINGSCIHALAAPSFSYVYMLNSHIVIWDAVSQYGVLVCQPYLSTALGSNLQYLNTVLPSVSTVPSVCCRIFVPSLREGFCINSRSANGAKARLLIINK